MLDKNLERLTCKDWARIIKENYDNLCKEIFVAKQKLYSYPEDYRIDILISSEGIVHTSNIIHDSVYTPILKHVFKVFSLKGWRIKIDIYDLNSNLTEVTKEYYKKYNADFSQLWEHIRKEKRELINKIENEKYINYLADFVPSVFLEFILESLE